MGSAGAEPVAVGFEDLGVEGDAVDDHSDETNWELCSPFRRRFRFELPVCSTTRGLAVSTPAGS